MAKATFYNSGACHLFSRGMKHLANLKRETLDPIDIHQSDVVQGMPFKEDSLRNLHLKRGDDSVVVVDAHVAAWPHTRFGMLWVWLRWPIIKQIVDTINAFWAARRYESLCGASAKRTKPRS